MVILSLLGVLVGLSGCSPNIQWKTIQVALGQPDRLGSAFLPVFLVVLTATAIYFTILCTGDAKDEKKGPTHESEPALDDSRMETRTSE